jgi:hypothetical protein
MLEERGEVKYSQLESDESARCVTPTSKVLAFMAGPSACVVQVASSDSNGSTLAPSAISFPRAIDPL